MVEAYQRGMVRSGRAEQVARDVLGRLTADGLTPEQARDAYVAVHAVVLGYALMRSGRESDLAGVPLAHLVDKVLDGVAP